MHRLARLVGAMYSVYRSKHALSAGKNREFGGAAVEHQGGRKTVNYRGPNSPRLLWIGLGAPYDKSPTSYPQGFPWRFMTAVA